MWVWPQPEHCYLICFIHSLSSQVLSLIHSFSTLWTLNSKNCTLELKQWQVSSKPLSWSIRGSAIRPLFVLWRPLLKSSPSLSCPPASLSTRSRVPLHRLCLMPTKLAPSVSTWPNPDLYGLIQISALPLNLKLSRAHLSVSHIPCSSFLHSTYVLSLISSATKMGFNVRPKSEFCPCLCSDLGQNAYSNPIDSISLLAKTNYCIVRVELHVKILNSVPC